MDRALLNFIGSQTQFHAKEKKEEEEKNGVHQIESVQVYRAGLHPQPFAPLTPSDGDRLAAHPPHEYNETRDDLWTQHRAHLSPFISVSFSRRRWRGGGGGAFRPRIKTRTGRVLG